MISYMEPKEIEKKIKNKLDNYLVVDVRDDDYELYKIKGSKNYPSYKFEKEAEKLYDYVKSKSIQDIIFHCTYSQVRGPKAAKHFQEKYKEFNIFVLKGGILNFVNYVENESNFKEILEYLN
jgi:rhodanese-related sulfurtransferase